MAFTNSKLETRAILVALFVKRSSLLSQMLWRWKSKDVEKFPTSSPRFIFFFIFFFSLLKLIRWQAKTDQTDLLLSLYFVRHWALDSKIEIFQKSLSKKKNIPVSFEYVYNLFINIAPHCALLYYFSLNIHEIVPLNFFFVFVKSKQELQSRRCWEGNLYVGSFFWSHMNKKKKTYMMTYPVQA